MRSQTRRSLFEHIGKTCHHYKRKLSADALKVTFHTPRVMQSDNGKSSFCSVSTYAASVNNYYHWSKSTSFGSALNINLSVGKSWQLHFPTYVKLMCTLRLKMNSFISYLQKFLCGRRERVKRSIEVSRANRDDRILAYHQQNQKFHQRRNAFVYGT